MRAPHFCAAENDAYALSATGGLAAQKSRPRSMTRTSTCCAVWCMIRRRGEWAAWPAMRDYFPRRTILRNLPRLLLNGGGRHSFSAVSREDDAAGTASVGAGAARFRLGHRLSVFLEPRRSAAGRLLWAYRVYRNIDVDRSNHQDLHHSADQCRASAWEGKCDRAALESGDGGCGGVAADCRARKKRCAGKASPATTKRKAPLGV